MPGQCREHLRRIARTKQMGVVDDEHEAFNRAQPGREPWELRCPPGAVERSDPVEGRSELGEQNGWVVVAVVDREPGERSAVPRGPLRGERRLSVSGRR